MLIVEWLNSSTGSESGGLQETFVESSFTPFSKVITLSSTEMASGDLTLDINDDQVALEDDERITVTLSIVDKTCSIVELRPYSQSHITVIDNDGKQKKHMIIMVIIIQDFPGA